MLQILTRPPDNSDVLTPLDLIDYQTVCAGHILIALFFSLFCRLQSSRILQRKRKRMLKHFSNSSLLQNPVTFVRNYSIYQSITDFTEGCLGRSVWVQKIKDCYSVVLVLMCFMFVSFFPCMAWQSIAGYPQPKQFVVCWYPFIWQCKGKLVFLRNMTSAGKNS